VKILREFIAVAMLLFSGLPIVGTAVSLANGLFGWAFFLFLLAALTCVLGATEMAKIMIGDYDEPVSNRG
jgi:membrane protein YqaA with SNARE-associated domain